MILSQLEQDILDEIQNNRSFEDYYQSYVMTVQDQNIDKELSYMFKYNIVSIDLVDRAILKLTKEIDTDANKSNYAAVLH